MALCLHGGAHNRRAVAQTALVEKKDRPGQPASDKQNKYSEEPPKKAQGGQPASEQNAAQGALKNSAAHKENADQAAADGQITEWGVKRAKGSAAGTAAAETSKEKAARAADVQATERGGEQEKGSAAATAAAETSREKAARGLLFQGGLSHIGEALHRLCKIFNGLVRVAVLDSVSDAMADVPFQHHLSAAV